MRSYQPFQQNIVPLPNRSVPIVIEQFRALDCQNKELLKLAENVQRSSFMTSNLSTPPIIHRLQQELRRNLSILIDSIRQVFIDMDKRLRALAQIIEQQSNTQKVMNTQSTFMSAYPNDNIQRQRENTFYGANQSNTDPYPSLVQRISSLQINLRNTQQNQAKLISIIQRLERRTGQQPTITSELDYQSKSNAHKDFRKHHTQISKLDNSSSQNSFRLFALRSHCQNQNHNKPKLMDKQSMPMNRQKNSQPSPFICFGEAQSDSLEPSRMEPQMPPNYQRNYASTHSHRLNFMMNTLNS